MSDRRLVSTETCVREEITGPTTNGTTPALTDVATRQDIDQMFVMCPDTGWSGLPATVPPGNGRHFDERDRRLTAAANAAAEAEEAEAWLVTDDEDLISNLLDDCMMREVYVFPVSSGNMLLRLFECGAITEGDLTSVLDAEEERLEQETWMSPRKRAAKEETLNRIAVRLGRDGT
jgi:hypothetical protein